MNRIRYNNTIRNFVFPAIIIFFMVLGCTEKELPKAEQISKLPQGIDNIVSNNFDKIGKTGQIIIVSSVQDNPNRVKLYALEKSDDRWTVKFPAMDTVIGKNGFAGIDQKREGDGKTPTGIFHLGTSFGYNTAIDTKMLYRQSTENDFWIDDVNSDKYNTWVTGHPNAGTYERMKRSDHLYKYGIVVEYNTDPVVKGMGSAIFIHVWRNPGSKTAGCVALSEENILKLLGWLDPCNEPLIIMGNDSVIQNVTL